MRIVLSLSVIMLFFLSFIFPATAENAAKFTLFNDKDNLVKLSTLLEKTNTVYLKISIYSELGYPAWRGEASGIRLARNK